MQNTFTASQILTSVKENHSCHVNAKCNNTLGSHICECQPGYTGNGQKCTGEFNFFVAIFRIGLYDTFGYGAAPFSHVTRQFYNLLLITRYDLDSCFSC